MSDIGGLLGRKPWEEVTPSQPVQAPIDPAALRASMQPGAMPGPMPSQADMPMGQAQMLAQRQGAVAQAADPIAQAFQAVPLGQTGKVAIDAGAWERLKGILATYLGGGR